MSAADPRGDERRASARRQERDAADRRLFNWSEFKHRQLRPIAERWGPQINIQNNAVVAAPGSEFERLLHEFEQRLALYPPEKRGELIEMLREGTVIDAEPGE